MASDYVLSFICYKNSLVDKTFKKCYCSFTQQILFFNNNNTMRIFCFQVLLIYCSRFRHIQMF
jgi:hypothetical protein